MRNILWYNHLRHTATEEYDNNGKDWYFRFGDDAKMSYEYVLSTTYMWMGQFNTQPHILRRK